MFDSTLDKDFFFLSFSITFIFFSLFSFSSLYLFLSLLFLYFLCILCLCSFSLFFLFFCMIRAYNFSLNYFSLLINSFSSSKHFLPCLQALSFIRYIFLVFFFFFFFYFFPSLSCDSLNLNIELEEHPFLLNL